MTVSIVLPIRNGAEVTRACLESLSQGAAASLKWELILVDNGSEEGLATHLRELAGTHPDIHLVRNDHNLGWPIACNQGMARARGEFVILLNSDTEVTPGWLDRLLAPFADPSVGLVGPRSDNVSGPQSTGVRADWQEAALHLATAKGDTYRLTDRLVGFCLAIRREVIERIGALDPRFGLGNFDDDDYCLRAQLAGWKLAIAEGCFVHHVGGATFRGEGIDYSQAFALNRRKFAEKWASLGLQVAPLAEMACRHVEPDALRCALPKRSPRISVCMIVRDEEAFLADCLRSVQGAVDEICIVDTGSTDRTIEIAESFGARVERMEWAGNFAAARNRSLDMATGDRILVLDADERLCPESVAEMRWLSWLPLEFGAVVQIERSPVLRWLRGGIGIQYEGRIHEQPTLPGRTVPDVELSGIRVRHLGYQPEVITDRDKIARNLAIARQMGFGTFHGAFNLCRCHWDAGHYREAERFGRLAREIARTPSDAIHAGVMEIAAAGTRDAEDALTLAIALRDRYPGRPHLAFLVGKLLAQLGRLDEAMAALDWRTDPRLAAHLSANCAAPEMSTPGTRLREACAIYVDCARALRRLSHAVAYLGASIEVTPAPDPALYELLAHVLGELGEWQKAGEVLHRGLKLAPGSRSGWALMAHACDRLALADLASAARRNLAALAT